MEQGGGRRTRDLTGRRFGRLTVLEYGMDASGKQKWKCRCDCGNVVYKATGHLNAGAVSCGCLKKKDLTGRRFGKLTVLGRAEGKRQRNLLWQCRCDCGNLCEKPTAELNAGTARSCGCNWRQQRVRAGDRFGRLVAEQPTGQRTAKSVVWRCRCDCGNTADVRSTLLVSGHTTSCGCVRQELDKVRDFKKILTYTDGTCIEFARNIGKRRADTSPDTGVRGVVLRGGSYQAQITFRKKRYYLGRFSRLEDAVKARKQAEERVEAYAENFEKQRIGDGGQTACPQNL